MGTLQNERFVLMHVPVGSHELLVVGPNSRSTQRVEGAGGARNFLRVDMPDASMSLENPVTSLQEIQQSCTRAWVRDLLPKER